MDRGEQMSLNQKQWKFTEMLGELIEFARSHGYKMSVGDAYATSGHMENSLHYQRLAIDWNLFKDGAYLIETRDHLPLGEFWESIGGSWGGRFKDGNHYSLEHEGRK